MRYCNVVKTIINVAEAYMWMDYHSTTIDYATTKVQNKKSMQPYYK